VLFVLRRYQLAQAASNEACLQPELLSLLPSVCPGLPLSPIASHKHAALSTCATDKLPAGYTICITSLSNPFRAAVT